MQQAQLKDQTAPHYYIIKCVEGYELSIDSDRKYPCFYPSALGIPIKASRKNKWDLVIVIDGYMYIVESTNFKISEG